MIRVGLNVSLKGVLLNAFLFIITLNIQFPVTGLCYSAGCAAYFENAVRCPMSLKGCSANACGSDFVSGACDVT